MHPSGPTVSRNWATTICATWYPYGRTVTEGHNDALGHQVSMLVWALCPTVLKMFGYFSFPPVQLFDYMAEVPCGRTGGIISK